MKQKMKITALLCTLATACLGSGIVLGMQNVDANAANSSENISFSMRKGASIRLKEDSNGIRFAATIDKADYEAIESDTVSYGMLIMPEDYLTTYGELTVENVFGSEAIYDWAAEDGSYTGTKTRIINITYDALGMEGGEYVIRGSITNVKTSNLGRNFVARAYINNDGAYEMADYAENLTVNNTRSMLDVAESALSDVSENAPTEEQKTAIRDSYVNLSNYTAVSTYAEFCAMETNGRYYLVNDIDFAGKTATGAFLTSGEFSGRFYGNGYSLKNVGLGKKNTYGEGRSLFGNLSGTVRDVKITATVTNEMTLSGDAVLASRMTDGVIDGVDLSVTFNRYGQTYGEGYGWNSYQEVSAGMVQNFLGGVIKNSNVTIATPTNNSTVDGIVAISNSYAADGYVNSNGIIDNVKVYTYSDDIKLYVNKFKGNPTVVNSTVINKNVTYVKAQDCIFAGGTPSTEKVAEGCTQSTVVPRGWSATPNISFNVNTEAAYTELKFYILGVNSGEYFQLRVDGGEEDLFAFEGDNATFYEIRFVKEGETWTVYFGSEWKAGGIASINAMDIYMNGTYYVSELFGIENPDYVAPAEPIQEIAQDCIFAEGTLSTEKVADGCTQSTKITTAWKNTNFAVTNEVKYTELKFYVCAGSGEWFELYKDNDKANSCVFAFAGENEKFYEVKFIKEGETWTIYLNGEWKAGGIESINTMVVTINGTYYVSELIGIVNPNYVYRVLGKTIYAGSTETTAAVDAPDTEEVPAALITEIYQFVGADYARHNFNSLDMTAYERAVFYIRIADASSGNNWLQIAVGETYYLQKNDDAWHKVEFKKESGSINVYIDGTQKTTVSDLSELSFAGTPSAVYYITALYGIDLNYVEPEEVKDYGWTVVNNSVFSEAGTVKTDKLAAGSKQSTYYNLSWIAAPNITLAIDEGSYTELKFYLSVSTYIEVFRADDFGGTSYVSCSGSDAFHEVKFVKEDGTWTLYFDDIAKDSGFATINGTFGIRLQGDVYVSELFAIDETYVPAAEEAAPDYVIAQDCIFSESGTVDTGKVEIDMSSQSTKITTGWKNTNFAVTNEVKYTELKFYVCAGSGEWFELYKDNDKSVNVFTFKGDNETFNEVKFIKEGETWTVYLNGDWKAGGIESINTMVVTINGTYYVSELFGIEDLSYIEVDNIAQDCIFAEGTPSTDKLATGSAQSTVVSRGWSSTPNISFNVINEAAYTQLKFYIWGVNSGEWFELFLDGGANSVVAFNGNNEKFHEMKFVKENGTWTLYYDGTQTATGIASINAMDIKMNGTYYVSELFGEDDGRLYLLNGTASEYKIVHDGVAENVTAAEELQKFFKEATGVELAVEERTEKHVKGGRYIFIGSQIAKDDYRPFVDLTKESSYNIVSGGRSVYVYGNDWYGTLNGVYALLTEWFGLEIYAEDVYTFNAVSELVYDAVNLSGSMVFDYQYSGYGAIRDDQNSGSKYDERLGFVTDYLVSTGGAHNTLTLISEKEFGSKHSEWFYTGTTSDGSSTGKQLYLAVDDFATGEGTLVTTVAQKLAAQIADEPNMNIFGFTPMDIDIWPTGTGYENSDTLKATYGTNSAEYILFMNAVANELEGLITRKVQLQLLAYNKTLCAPVLTNLTAEQQAALKLHNGTNVQVVPYVAPVEANFSMAFTDTKNTVKNPETGVRDNNSPTVATVIQNWNVLSDEIFLWWYALDASCYFMPMDTITNMQANYRFAAANGVTVMYNQAQHDTPVSTDWAALKMYLQSKLAENPEADVATLKTNFMNNYFGAGGTAMSNLLAAQQTWYAKLRGHTTYDADYNLGRLFGSGFFTGAEEDNAIQWTENISKVELILTDKDKMLDSWMSYITTAKTAVYNDSTLTDAQKNTIIKRIDIESLTIRYVYVKVFGTTTYDTSVEAFYTYAKSLGVTKSGEGAEIK